MVHELVEKSDITLTNNPTKWTNFNVLFTEVKMRTYIHLCTSYIDDFTTIPYIGDYNIAY